MNTEHLTTADLQRRYDEDLRVIELADKIHIHGGDWLVRECISCLKRAISEIDHSDRVYTDHWLETK
jgi:hypothetical protein